MYLFGLDCHLGAEAGLQRVFHFRLAVLALHIVLANDGPVVADGRLEVVIRKRRVAVFKRVLRWKEDKRVMVVKVSVQVKEVVIIRANNASFLLRRYKFPACNNPAAAVNSMSPNMLLGCNVFSFYPG